MFNSLVFARFFFAEYIYYVVLQEPFGTLYFCTSVYLNFFILPRSAKVRPSFIFVHWRASTVCTFILATIFDYFGHFLTPFFISAIVSCYFLLHFGHFYPLFFVCSFRRALFCPPTFVHVL